MRQNNAFDGNYVATQTLKTVPQGGTGASSPEGLAAAVGGISKEALNRPGGLAVAGQSGLVDPSHIPPQFAVGPTLALRTVLSAGTQAQVEITNFDMKTAYRVEISPNCPYYLSGSSIYFTPAADGPYKLIVNGKEVTYVVGPQKPNAPSIIYPTSGATGVSDKIMLMNNGFSDPAGVAFKSSRWQLSLSATFATLAYDSGEYGVERDRMVEGLSPNQTYYARVCHTNKAGITSDWSTIISFQTAVDFIPNTATSALTSAGRTGFGRRFVTSANENVTVVYDAFYKDVNNVAVGFDGALQVYTPRSTMPAFTLPFKRNNFPVEVDDCSLALSADGKFLAVALRSFDKGSDKNIVNIYSVDDNKLYLLQTLSSFDETVSSSLTNKLTVRFSDDGSYLAVGSPGSVVGGAVTGAVMVFYRDKGVFNRQAVITRAGAAGGDRIGTAVAINGDGSKIAYSMSPLSGANNIVYTQARTNTTWAAGANITAASAVAADKFGTHIEMTSDGTRVAVAAPGTTVGGMADRGQVYVFNFASNAWSMVGTGVSPSTLVAGEKFGSSLRIARGGSSSGSLLAVGCEEMKDGTTMKAGAVFLWNVGASTFSATPDYTLRSPAPSTNGRFGACIAMTSTGGSMNVGECTYDPANVSLTGPGKIHRFK